MLSELVKAVSVVALCVDLAEVRDGPEPVAAVVGPPKAKNRPKETKMATTTITAMSEK